jgi:hypothetical protein
MGSSLTGVPEARIFLRLCRSPRQRRPCLPLGRIHQGADAREPYASVASAISVCSDFAFAFVFSVSPCLLRNKFTLC